MYTLLYGLWKHTFRKDDYFILILGLDNAGKTTFLEQTKTKFNPDYKMMNPSKITSTVGLNIGKIDSSGVRLNFWDLGGQEELQSLWDKYYAESHGIIFVIDSSDSERLNESWIAFDKILDSETLHGVPLLVVCNKQDVEGCLTIPDIKTVFHESAAKLGHRDCTVMAVSALNGTNIQESIGWITQCIKRNSAHRPPRLD